MEVLIAACLLAWAAGAQSEQAKLGMSPAERGLRREHVRHEKTVRKLAEKYGTEPPPEEPLTIPEAFRSGYRGRTPLERVATPVGRRLGDWAAKGVYWGRDTGRSAVKEYRNRRIAEGAPDPAPVVAPPVIPPKPAEPPTVGARTGISLGKPETPPVPAASPPTPAEAADPAAEAAARPASPTAPTNAPAVPASGSPEPEPAGSTTPASPESTPTQPEKAVGRMAAEVTYESVRDESEELSLMCDDDLHVYDRLQTRCEREIGRADELIAALRNAGVGALVTGWVARCLEQYQVIHAQLGQLRQQTHAQDEAVVKAKNLLEAGQGVYAGIAADMESVAQRPFYVNDAVDSEDADAHTELFETTGA